MSIVEEIQKYRILLENSNSAWRVVVTWIGDPDAHKIHEMSNFVHTTEPEDEDIKYNNGKTTITWNFDNEEKARRAEINFKDLLEVDKRFQNPTVTLLPGRTAMNESYDDRVSKIANNIISTYRNSSITADKLKSIILSQARDLGVPDVRAITINGKPSKSQIQFVKDVLDAVKSQIKLGREKSSKPSKKEKYQKLANLIQSSVGESFPDGDPIDMIMFKAHKYGLDKDFINGDNLDKAVKLLGSYKNYNDYLADFWDDIKGDNPNFPGIGDTNPWRH